MPAVPAGQTRRLSAGLRVRTVGRRVRAATLGLFAFCAVATGCATDPHAAAAQFDRRHATALFTWLADHAPSAVVAWHIDAASIREVDPVARVIVAGPHPCLEAGREHAALVVLFGRAPDELLRDAALDCGVALFRDRGGVAIAPR